MGSGRASGEDPGSRLPSGNMQAAPVQGSPRFSGKDRRFSGAAGTGWRKESTSHMARSGSSGTVRYVLMSVQSAQNPNDMGLSDPRDPAGYFPTCEEIQQMQKQE